MGMSLNLYFTHQPRHHREIHLRLRQLLHGRDQGAGVAAPPLEGVVQDRKSTRLNSSHVRISYAVFCLKKKNPTPCDDPRQDVLGPLVLGKVSLSLNTARPQMI